MPLNRRAAGSRPARLCVSYVVATLSLTWIAAVVGPASTARADQYDAPASYYNAATGTGTTLKGQLYTIISTGMIGRSYGDARYAFAKIDQDPANASNILLAYNRASVSGTWDAGATYNREHVWPKSLLGVSSSTVTNSYTGIASDLFELRPTNTQINSDRDNYPYGKLNATVPPAGYGLVSDATGTYWYPGAADRGDVARSIFYMATRYGQGQTNNVTLVDNQPSTYQMGDKTTLLHWHYQDAVDTFERKRNQTIYSQSLNPTYYQNNRNPFIDHPEYVWSVFGGGNNNAQLSVATADAGGASASTVDLGKVILGSAFGTGSVTLNKSGSNPTTFDATVAGSASSTLSGPRQTFDYGAGARTITVGLTGATSAAGPRSGTITFDNTDITSGGAGQGSADGNDVVTVTGTAVAHATPSFALAATQTAQTIDFGIVAQDAAAEAGFAIADRAPSGVYVAGLDIDSAGTPADAAFATTLVAPQGNLAAGTAAQFAASVNGTTLGVHASSIAIATSDENIPGATTLSTLTLSLTARIAIGGDATLDDAVNFDDLLVVAQNYGADLTTWVTGDFDRTGTTEFGDLLTLAQHYGTAALSGRPSLAGAAGVTPSFVADWALAQSLVPEPTTLAMLGFAAVTMRRRRSI